MANPRLPNITESEQELLYEKLNIYNQGKASYKEVGCYLVVLPREGHPNYSLWFYTPLLDRRCILFIEDLKPDIIQSLRIVTSELWYANRPHPDHGLQRKEDVDTRGRPDRFRQIPRTLPV